MQLIKPLHRCTRRCGDERGFTVLLALFVLTITTLLLGGAYFAVFNDTALSRNDLDQKRAYAAAQAGLQVYNYALNQNINFWSLCTPPSGTVPGSLDAGSNETYATTQLIATTAPSGTTVCDASNPIGTMIEGSTSAAPGTFRISSTGTSRNVSRTIVAQYTRTSFLNFVYYTEYEILDPTALYSTGCFNYPSGPFAGNSGIGCSQPKQCVTGPGPYQPGCTTIPTDCARHYTDVPGRGVDCQAIQFRTGDFVKGPLHSEDSLLVCGTPVFGRWLADRIEAAGHSDEGTGCGDSANIQGTFSVPKSPLNLPPSNVQLVNVTDPNYHFFGATTIVLKGSVMDVTNGGVTTPGMAFPANGVIYVSDNATNPCAVAYTPFAPVYAPTDANCGNVYVSGTYNTKSLTIAASHDIIINGNILTTPVDGAGKPTGNYLLGLIANNFVRVYHPMSGTRASDGSCNNLSNVTGSGLPITTIYAAILAVNHSFIVDNYDCGAQLGTLTVWGAIAQNYRGPVGTSGSQVTGYLKNYNYDDRVAATEPPYFLNPVKVAWVVQRQTECNVAASC
jgi:Tfp pilus assembly protein PilX